MAEQFAHPGDRYTITRIERSDPDAYAVIHYGERWAFPCTGSWFNRERPEVGDVIVLDSDHRWHVEKPRADV